MIDLLAKQAFPLDLPRRSGGANYADLTYLEGAVSCTSMRPKFAIRWLNWGDEDSALTLAKSGLGVHPAGMGPPKPGPVFARRHRFSKTEIYMQAVRQVIENGGRCLILAGISMTPQTVRRFMARFPSKVVFIIPNSRRRALRYLAQSPTGDLQIIIGSRSALFLPMPKLNLIVIDECDNDSYGKTDACPFITPSRPPLL